jgi:hypothetical protein
MALGLATDPEGGNGKVATLVAAFTCENVTGNAATHDRETRPERLYGGG